MDPVMHLMLPLLLMLALRVDTKLALLLAPLAVLPDFDAFTGMHRAVFHSFIPIIILPVSLILFAHFRRPMWLLPAFIAQFYLLSHLLLDLGGVAFLWPVTDNMYYFEPELRFTVQGGIDFDFNLSYGVKPYEPMGETYFIESVTFGFIFLIIITIVLYRKEAFALLRTVGSTVKGLFIKA